MVHLHLCRSLNLDLWGELLIHINPFVFGAWVADKIERENLKIDTAADIGTGTGLLSLMLAQKSIAKIDAFEIDEDAARQATQNFKNSFYSRKLQVIQADINIFAAKTQYDLVISNPPFFENDLKSENAQRNIALHNGGLTLEQLLISAQKMLKQSGIFCVLLPFSRSHFFIQLAHITGMYLHEELRIRQTEKHSYFRSILLFSCKKGVLKTGEMNIKKENQYSDEFISLLKDYYLFL